MLKKYSRLMAAAAVLAVTLLISGCGASKSGQPEATPLPRPAAPLPADLISRDQAAKIVQDLVGADKDQDNLAAYLYPEVLRPGDEVSAFGDDPEKGDKSRAIDQYSYLAWIDREPADVFFSHDTEFVFVDARSGQAERESHGYWPLVNGEPFGRDQDSRIAGAPVPPRVAAGWRADVASYVKGLSIPPARAADDGRPRITPDVKNAPPGEYYALIVSGYGENSWVFLEGAWQMYDALKAAGYDDAHITMLAPRAVRIAKGWNYVGEPPTETDGGLVDGTPGPEGVLAALKDITAKMTEKDSLFVFVIAHGEPNWLALGRPLAKPDAATVRRNFEGFGGSLWSKHFSQALLGQTKACEIMAIFDSCYATSEKAQLSANFDPSRIKRLAAAFASDKKAKGADHREPDDKTKPATIDLDKGAPKSKIADKNPEDIGGEFSSGLIVSLNKRVFGAIYAAGTKLDAAALNKLTRPELLDFLGEDGPCVSPLIPMIPSNVYEGPGKAPEEPEPESTPPAKPMKKISVISYGGSYITVDQLTQYTAAQCKCCDAPHWHAKNGTVTTIDGKKVTDPYANCGLGKVSEHPVTTIEVAQ